MTFNKTTAYSYDGDDDGRYVYHTVTLPAATTAYNAHIAVAVRFSWSGNRANEDITIRIHRGSTGNSTVLGLATVSLDSVSGNVTPALTVLDPTARTGSQTYAVSVHGTENAVGSIVDCYGAALGV